MIDNLLCNKNKTLYDVLSVINNNGKGIAFIVDESNKLCGVLTDGDIRRSLLGGKSLTSLAGEVIGKTFVSAVKTDAYDQMLKKISANVQIFPIVDEQNKVVDYFEYRSDIHVPVAIPDLRGNELNYLMDAFKSTWISSSGKYITRFEEGFAGYCECAHGVAVSNGTVALHLALKALGVGEGDEVIVPDLTFAATINTVLHSNATPVIVDIEEDSWCIAPSEIEKAITKRTKAIIPVHLYGQPCDMQRIMKIAKDKGLFVVEDAAEAHGARYKGKKVGSIGDIGCFSFFGNKVITTGEGGMCVTNSKELNEKMRSLRDHGMSKTKKYWHESVGFNYRMTNLQAAIGVAQLERIDEILGQRKEIENGYRKNLSSVKNIEFQKNDLKDREKITWLVCALVKGGDRDDLMSKLRAKGIDSRPFFYALSEMDIYKKYVFSNSVSRKITKEGLNFPTSFDLNKTIYDDIKEIFLKESA